MAELTDKNKLLLLKWDFLRRNPDYKKEYAALKKHYPNLFHGDIYFPCRRTKSGRFFSLKIKPEVRQKIEKFKKKWHVLDPISPDYNPPQKNEKIIKHRGKQPVKFEEYSNKAFACSFMVGTKDFKNADGPAVSLSLERLMMSDIFSRESLGMVVVKGEPGIFEVDDKIEYGDDRLILYSKITDKAATTGWFPVNINMMYSKDKIKKEFAVALDGWKVEYERRYKNWLFRKYCKLRHIKSSSLTERKIKEFEIYYNQELKKRLPFQNKKLRDLELYKKYLKVWDLKKAGKTWSQISRILGLNDIHTARDYKKAADNLIKEGFPL